MINLTKCADCIHQPVCKDRGEYIRIFNLLNDFELRDMIDGELRCKHFCRENLLDDPINDIIDAN